MRLVTGGRLPHRSIYLLGIATLAGGLPLSETVTSIGEGILLVNWIVEGNFRKKWEILKERKSLWLIASVYLVHVLGLIITSDFEYAFHDLRIKLPYLILPVVIGTSPQLDRIQLKWIIIIFSFFVTIGTLVSTSILFGLISHPINNVHEISIFIDHIRFSLQIDLVVFCLLYFIISDEFRTTSWEYIIYSLVAIWLIIFLFMLKSLTGIFIFLAAVFILFWIHSPRIRHLVLRWFFTVMMITAVLICISYLAKSISRFYTVIEPDRDHLEDYTVNGNPYVHDLNNMEMENGYYVWIYLCEEELRKEWNKISNLDYDGRDKMGNKIRYTIIRYLTSKGLRKDSVGIAKLTIEDIHLIEEGKANYIYGRKTAIYPKLYEVIWQIDRFRKGANPSGHSVTQRILYLKAGIGIIKQHFWFGVGTGDVADAFHDYYEDSNSKLDNRWRLRAHNQYVTFFLTFGVFGFLWIMFSLIYPVFLEKKWVDYFWVVFFVIGFLSMMNEDTLETHIGNSFFSFFYALLLLGVKNKNQ
jgi:hypothetical protein